MGIGAYLTFQRLFGATPIPDCPGPFGKMEILCPNEVSRGTAVAGVLAGRGIRRPGRPALSRWWCRTASPSGWPSRSSARGEDVELVALRVGQARPRDVALAEVDVGGAECSQPGHLHRLIVTGIGGKKPPSVTLGKGSVNYNVAFAID